MPRTLRRRVEKEHCVSKGGLRLPKPTKSPPERVEIGRPETRTMRTLFQSSSLVFSTIAQPCMKILPLRPASRTARPGRRETDRRNSSATRVADSA